ncbi:GNAT family N-acetyltransferase [Spirillospora sp. NPDC047279]|uniref:GNAT family N-acetyltransferase n=1 Tax=Spirillospora sp. NPDC047279 TaxID=3155478 RepID=UPI0033F71603
MRGDEELERLRDRLDSTAGLRPVPSQEGRRFCRWDLASLVEGALGEILDPDTITAGDERAWQRRLGEGQCVLYDEDPLTHRYWITSGQEVIGTLGIRRGLSGWASAYVSSLYVHSESRRRGVASRTLDTVYRAAIDEGLEGIRLDTKWTWQDAVRYYLSRGFWTCSWKHDLGFTRQRGLPRYEVRQTGRHSLAFLLAHRGEMSPLLVAVRDGERLVLEEAPLHRALRDDDDHWTTLLYGRSTLALQLAARGWPLIRSEEAWAEAPHHADLGDPEGLAFKIGHFERTARDNGWRVTVPAANGQISKSW